jgi:hypothetical protein
MRDLAPAPMPGIENATPAASTSTSASTDVPMPMPALAPMPGAGAGAGSRGPRDTSVGYAGSGDAYPNKRQSAVDVVFLSFVFFLGEFFFGDSSCSAYADFVAMRLARSSPFPALFHYPLSTSLTSLGKSNAALKEVRLSVLRFRDWWSNPMVHRRRFRALFRQHFDERFFAVLA